MPLRADQLHRSSSWDGRDRTCGRKASACELPLLIKSERSASRVHTEQLADRRHLHEVRVRPARRADACVPLAAFFVGGRGSPASPSFKYFWYCQATLRSSWCCYSSGGKAYELHAFTPKNWCQEGASLPFQRPPLVGEVPPRTGECGQDYWRQDHLTQTPPAPSPLVILSGGPIRCA